MFEVDEITPFDKEKFLVAEIDKINRFLDIFDAIVRVYELVNRFLIFKVVVYHLIMLQSSWQCILIVKSTNISLSL